jgi:hypothetical protein
MTMISLKVSPEKLERIDAEAKRLGITRTDLLLKPWTQEPIASSEVLTVRFDQAFRPKHAIDCKCLMCKPPNSTQSKS